MSSLEEWDCSGKRDGLRIRFSEQVLLGKVKLVYVYAVRFDRLHLNFQDLACYENTYSIGIEKQASLDCSNLMMPPYQRSTI